MNSSISLDEVRLATLKLLNYCKVNDWAGYDPYDALNSKLFEALPLLARRMPDLSTYEAIEWKGANIGIWGPTKLPLAFTASA